MYKLNLMLILRQSAYIYGSLRCGLPRGVFCQYILSKVDWSHKHSAEREFDLEI